MLRQPLFTDGTLLGPDWPLPRHLPFTTRTATTYGISARALARLLRDGYLRRVLKGVLVAAQVQDSLSLRARALALVTPPGAVVTDWTATWLHTGLLRPGDHLEVPPVSVFLHAGAGRLRNPLVASGERTFRRDDLCRVDGIVATTPVRTAWDIGRLVHRDRAIGALDGLLRTGEFTREELLAGVERFRGHRGVVQLRALAPLADGRSESPGESLLRLRWLDIGSIPAPDVQVPVLGDDGQVRFRLDLGVPTLRFAAEYDGQAYHTEADREHDQGRREWIRRERGWIVVVIRKENVSGVSADVERQLIGGVREARRQLGRFRPSAVDAPTRRP